MSNTPNPYEEKGYVMSSYIPLSYTFELIGVVSAVFCTP